MYILLNSQRPLSFDPFFNGKYSLLSAFLIGNQWVIWYLVPEIIQVGDTKFLGIYLNLGGCLQAHHWLLGWGVRFNTHLKGSLVLPVDIIVQIRHTLFHIKKLCLFWIYLTSQIIQIDYPSIKGRLRGLLKEWLVPVGVFL